MTGNYLKILPESLEEKKAMHELFKNTNVQHYLISNREIPLRVVIRGLPKNNVYMDDIQSELQTKGFSPVKLRK